MTQHLSEEVKTEEAKNSAHARAEKKFTVEGIPGGVLKALHSHAARQRSRWSLDCIRLEGRELVAADGSVLARLNLPDELGPAELFKLEKPSLRKRQPAKITRQNGRLKVEQSDGASVRQETYQAAGDRARWPEHYEDAIPPEGEAAEVRCSLSYLQNALDLLDCAGCRGAKLTFPAKEGQPFRVDGIKPEGQEDREIGVTVVISPLASE